MQVLFLPKWYPNEYDPYDGNFIENHAHAIQQKVNVKVLFVHSEDRDSKDFRILKQQNRGIDEVRVFFPKPKSSINFVNKVISFFRYLEAQKIGYKELYKENEKPDLVHIHVLSRPALLALTLQKSLQIPFVITEHWSGYLKENGKYRGFLKKLFTRFVVRKASGVHTVSSYLKNAMQSHNLSNDYTVIPNVVDTELFKPQTKDNKIPEIIFVGNLLQKPKKVFDIIKAVGELKKAGKQFHLSIYGEGIDEAPAKKLAITLGLNKEVSFKGTLNREGIGKAMGSSDFLILFSEFENQPCVIAEAHASGIPIIVPDIAGIAERMQAELGIMVKTGNQTEFVEALNNMLDNYQTYDSNFIRMFGVKQFGETEIANRFYHFYQKALRA